MSSTSADAGPAPKPSKWRIVRDVIRSIMNDPAPGLLWCSPDADRWVPDVVKAVVPPTPNQRKIRLQAEGVLSRVRLLCKPVASVWRGKLEVFGVAKRGWHL